ncbi:C40 family peptidase [Mycobacterium marinum]|uniref:C40 family peptidase n=1 Tax=Mycobacterium marinum TaxID=1781 RepID=UPI00356A9485
MIPTEVDALLRAHQMFVGTGDHRMPDVHPQPGAEPLRRATLPNPATDQPRYGFRAARGREVLAAATRTDAAVAAVIADAHRDREQARELTGNVVNQARADGVAPPVTPLAQREAIRRRVGRLRAQRAHVLWAHRRARRRLAALRLLRYRMLHHHGSRQRLSLINGRAGIAVRAALSRLGRPYVWGATGPDRFDCSGLVQWAYAQAGVHLDRTTYQQINDGIVVSRSQIRPGDLVFPHPGHVQLAIGNNLVVEAPHAGASVRISPLGNHVQIRRPL